MTIPIPLAVRIVTARQDVHITNRLADLSFRTAVPGGFASARFTIHGHLDLDPDELQQFARVYIYDARNGLVVWEGRLEDPGRSVGGNGGLYEVAALGPSTHARDRVAPVIYVDTRLTELVEATGSGRAYTVGTRESATSGDGALSISASQGSVVTTLSLGAAVYNAIYAAGQDLHRIYINWDGGFTSANTTVELRTAEDLGATTTVASATISTTASTLSGQLGAGGTPIPSGHNRFLLVLRRNGATLNPVADDNYWAEFYSIRVLGTRYNADGTAITVADSGTYVLADQVVTDVVGRLLPEYDGAAASIAATTYPIEQCAYPDGATAQQILDDMMEIEATFLWEALESNTAGKHRFVWRAWPTTVRYEADVTDGYTSTGSAAELFNAVQVRYRDALGQVRLERRTSTVAVLSDAGKTRDAFIDLGDEVSTQANAQQVGDQFLAEHQYAPAAGRLTIARRILDVDAGRMVEPWEIRPGHLIRLRSLRPAPAVLSGTARDGATTFKVVSVEYSAGDGAAQLELDAPAPTIARIIRDAVVALPNPKPGPVRRR